MTLNIKAYVGGSFHKAADFENGKTEILTIAGAAVEDFEEGDGTKKKVCLSFHETPKKLVINNERADQLIGIFADSDAENWEGHVVELYQGQTKFAGKPVGCVAIRKPQAPADTPNDDVPWTAAG